MIKVFSFSGKKCDPFEPLPPSDFSEHKKLLGTPLQRKPAHSELQCADFCFRNHRCVAFNIQLMGDGEGKRECQLMGQASNEEYSSDWGFRKFDYERFRKVSSFYLFSFNWAEKTSRRCERNCYLITEFENVVFSLKEKIVTRTPEGGGGKSDPPSTFDTIHPIDMKFSTYTKLHLDFQILRFCSNFNLLTSK